MESLRQVIAGVFAALLVSFPAPALAQAGRDARPALQVDDFDVEQVAHVGAGTQLRFSLFGSHGAVVALRIDGDDLIGAGVQRGPQVGRRLAATLDRRLDGDLGDDHGEQLAAALEAE